jgi:hypothetical protein
MLDLAMKLGDWLREVSRANEAAVLTMGGNESGEA